MCGGQTSGIKCNPHTVNCAPEDNGRTCDAVQPKKCANPIVEAMIGVGEFIDRNKWVITLTGLAAIGITYATRRFSDAGRGQKLEARIDPEPAPVSEHTLAVNMMREATEPVQDQVDGYLAKMNVSTEPVGPNGESLRSSLSARMFSYLINKGGIPQRKSDGTYIEYPEVAMQDALLKSLRSMGVEMADTSRPGNIRLDPEDQRFLEEHELLFNQRPEHEKDRFRYEYAQRLASEREFPSGRSERGMRAAAYDWVKIKLAWQGEGGSLGPVNMNDNERFAEDRRVDMESRIAESGLSFESADPTLPLDQIEAQFKDAYEKGLRDSDCRMDSTTGRMVWGSEAHERAAADAMRSVMGSSENISFKGKVEAVRGIVGTRTKPATIGDALKFAEGRLAFRAWRSIPDSTLSIFPEQLTADRGIVLNGGRDPAEVRKMIARGGLSVVTTDVPANDIERLLNLDPMRSLDALPIDKDSYAAGQRLVESPEFMLHNQQIIDSLEQSPKFKRLDSSKKIEVAQRVARSAYLNDKGGYAGVPADGREIKSEVIQGAMRESGLDVGQFSNLPKSVTLTRDQVKETAILKQFNEMRSELLKAGYRAYVREFSGVHLEDARANIAQYLMMRRNNMSSAMIKRMESIHAKTELWIKAEIDCLHSGAVVTDAAVTKRMTHIEVRDAMLEHLGVPRGVATSTSETAAYADEIKIAEECGRRAAEDNGFRSQYFPARNASDLRAREANFNRAIGKVAEALNIPSPIKARAADAPRASMRAATPGTAEGADADKSREPGSDKKPGTERPDYKTMREGVIRSVKEVKEGGGARRGVERSIR